ncbi:MAG: cyclopropane-fatty-acyl-phospholipid synthase [Paracoccaceae bacterium]|jgi:cyclopropane-fatty-acyl-phospholipid synthase
MRLLAKLMRSAIRVGTLTVRFPDGTSDVFGGVAPGPDVMIRVTDPGLGRKLFLNPELAAAEAYMDGRLIVEDGPEGGTAADLLDLVFRNQRRFDFSPMQVALKKADIALRRFMQRNAPSASRRNVAHHYDLGNDFYRMWLDADMQYSCGYFPEGEETLEQAQTLKKRRIAAKLGLKPGMRVLDIGCGWGGLALYLAAVADVEVVGVTLSNEQLVIATARAEAAGLADRVTFQLCDYRHVEGRFDRIVSVGMLEHVGIGHLPEYFATVRRLLAPDGAALIHSISANGTPGVTGPFIRRYIFPGGYAPCLSEATLAVEKSGLWMLDVEMWRVHYGHTLREWRRRFMARRAESVAMYDERFARMWEFYLAACECAWFHGTSTLFQMQLGATRDALPLHRHWIADEEARLTLREPDALARIDAATRIAFGEPAGQVRAAW